MRQLIILLFKISASTGTRFCAVFFQCWGEKGCCGSKVITAAAHVENTAQFRLVMSPFSPPQKDLRAKSCAG
jgi:hypothetical protein